MTDWWEMAARAARSRFRPGRATVRAGVALAVLGVPLVLGAQGSSAAAATGQSASLVSLTITSMSPTWASPDSTITVTGALRNTSSQQTENLTVQLLGSGTPVTSVPAPGTSAQAGSAAVEPLPGAAWHTSGELAPGSSVTWSVQVKASKLGMTGFGVYPLQVQVQSVLGTPLASQTTYLPYEPAKKSGYARPAAQQVAWLWPLIDKPLLSQPWQNDCRGSQAAQLARSLQSGGRLDDLLTAGQLTAGTAQAYTSQDARGGSAASQVARSQQSQSLAGADGLTWAIDPALLDDVHALADCGSRQPQWAKAASAWLSQLQQATADQPMFATPYGDVSLTALIAQGHSADVTRAFQLGRSVATKDLRRDLNPSADAGQITAAAWSPDGTASFTTLENLAASDGVRSLVLSAAELPDVQATVARAVDGGGSLNGGGSYVTLLLADASLTRLLASPGTGAAGAFATSQEFLALTALLAQQDPGQPIIVAPPQRFDPPAGLAADLLADTTSAPWLSPVTLSSLTTGPHIPNVTMPATAAFHRYHRHLLAELGMLARQVNELETIKVKLDPEPYEALFDIESSAWDGNSAMARAMVTQVSGGRFGIATQPQNVRIVAASRITLGGLKGSVPVSIDNSLNYAVQVRLGLQFTQSGGLKISKTPGLITVQAHTDLPLRLHVQLTKSGASTITVSLLDRNGHTLPANAVRMTVQATQVGILGMIIFAAGLGVFLLASAGRAVRRGRPVPPADLPLEPGHGDDQETEGGEGASRPDTVVPERTELGAAGTPGL